MKTKTKNSIKIFALILSVLMLIVSLPMTAFAMVVGNTSDSAFADGETSSNKEVIVLEEDESLREENIKHFKLSDGTTKAVVYPRAVHYKDADGKWVDIDNALTLNGSEYSTSNKSQIKFANKSGSNGLVSIKDGEYKIDFTPLNTNKVNVVIENPQSNNSRKFEDISVLNNLVSKATYADIYDGIDIEYILVGNNIKENIIVKEKQDSYTFSFELKLNKLSAKLEKGAIVLSDYDSGERVYEIPVPYMLDANNVYSPNVEYSLVQESKWKYTFTVIADAEWINSAERTFPVTIDPSLGITDDNLVDYSVSPYEEVSVPETELWVGNGFVSYIQLTSLPQLPNSAYITESTVSLKHLFGGTSSENGGYIGVHRAYGEYPKDYVRVAPNSDGTYGENGWYTWNIIDIVNGWYNSQITSYNLCFDAVSSTEMVKLASKENADRPLLTISYRDMKGVESYWSYISQGVGNAGNGSINLATGNLMFEIGTMSTTDSLFAFMPTMIYNSALAGLEYKYGYENAQVGYWGTYTANGFKANFNEALIKDSYINASGDSEIYYIWADSDGTEHYFIADENGIYRDEDGLQLTLSTNDNDITQDCIITDSAHNQRIFAHMSGVVSTEIEATWYLSKIRDVNGNELYFQIDGSKKPNDIKIIPNGSSAITMISPLYNSNSRLALLWNNSTKEGVVFRHSNTPTGELSANGGVYLREALYIKCDSDIGWSYVMNNFLGDFDNNTEGVTVNAVMKYTYDEDGYLTVAHDTLSDYKVEYTYTNGKITSVTEYGKNNAEGQTIGITYNSGYTEVRTSGSNDIYGDSDDLINVYTFDNQGRAISSYSTNLDRTEIYGATSGEYVSDNENAKNSLKISTVTGIVGTNYLLNGNFEYSEIEPTFWETQNASIVNPSTIPVNVSEWDDTKMQIYAVSNNTSYIEQDVKLSKGTYTLSLYFNSAYSEELTIKLKASSETESYEYLVSKNEVYASGGNSFVDFTFNVQENTSVFTIGVYVEASALVSNDAYITVDDIMLSNTTGRSAYNHVYFGNFDNTIENSTSNIGKWISNLENAFCLESESDNNGFGTSLKIQGEMREKTEVSQQIYNASIDIAEDDNSDDAINPSNIVQLLGATSTSKVFTISGFAKAENASSASNAKFAIRLDITYCTSGEAFETVSTYATYNSDNKNWQYASATFILPSNSIVENISITCEYVNNIGNAYFDNISLICEDDTTSTTRYYYYNNGRLRAEVNGTSSVVYYAYNANGDVIDRISNKERVTCEYNDKYQLISSNYYRHNVYLGYGNYPNNYYPNLKEKLDENQVLKSSSTYEYNAYGLLVKEVTKDSKGIEQITTNNTYSVSSGSRIFGAILSSENSLGDIVRYNYNSSNGRLNCIIEDDGQGYNYTYDEIGNLIKVVPIKASSSSQSVEYEYNEANQLDEIIANDTEYIFTYDDFGNQNSVSIGNIQIVSQEFSANNGKLLNVNYANGISVSYEYDELSRVVKAIYKKGEKSIVYEYGYDSNGNLNKFVDGENNTIAIYKYDTSGKLLKMIEYDNETMLNEYGVYYSYDSEARIQFVSYSQDYLYNSNSYDNLMTSYYYSYSDDSDSMLKQISISIGTQNEGWIDFAYDSFSRYSTKAISTRSIKNIVSYEYLTIGNETSSLVSSYVSTVTSKDGTASYGTKTFEYTYDSSHQNITEIKNGEGTLLQKYTYDDLDRLIREDNNETGYTWIYTYDDNGNILTQKMYEYTLNSVSNLTPLIDYEYSYGNSNWKDQLTEFDGSAITYDAVGNPLNYRDGMTFKWNVANNLLSITDIAGNKTSYAYNDEGIRTSKTIGEIKHKYILEGTKIVSEIVYDENGVEIYVLTYLYDELDSPIGFLYRNSNDEKGNFEKYLFTKNLQGDILSIYNEEGVEIGGYQYNAWGELCSVWNVASCADIVNLNPFRYRGYYFDSESGLYYLNSRYYDSQVKRFISPDNVNYLGAGSTIKSYNLYAYCENSPVSHLDTEGNFLCAAIGALAGGVFGAIGAFMEGKSGQEVWASVANGAISGAISGLAADVIIITGGSAAVVIGVSAMAGAVGSYVGTITENAINGNDLTSTEVQTEAMIDAAWGGVFGALGGMMTGSVSSMMDDALKSAGPRRIAGGVTVGYAATKAVKKECRSIGMAFVEEFLGNFNSWFTQKSLEYTIGGIKK